MSINSGAGYTGLNAGITRDDKMRKPIVFFIFILFSCAAFNLYPQEQDMHLVSGSSKGALVVIGVSGRQRRRHEEIESALEDAARKVALYHGLKGKVVTVHKAGADFFDFYLNIDVRIDPAGGSGYDIYKNELKYDGENDVIRTNSAVFVRFTYPVSRLNPARYDSGLTGGKPAWLHNPPEISGYITGVGFAKNQRWIKETIEKSCESAITALLARTSATIKMRDADLAANGASSANTEITEIIEGELTDFQILEIWIEPKTSSVWTLAVAKKKE
ncbi:MAG: LPP20 family lipoprotein [Treponema sp.]|nr:LPP20 family lipoprotein [Treponema sp.]